MTTALPKLTRCAVYTRKSSEEGLDMAFNSLDAQREAGRDYIKSQKHQGWVAIENSYDDGGFSGGSTDRPGLQRLLADIQAGRVDVVLVYKVDRLSRSLADFARLMQTFDEHKVSFVSVTQQFNTTTSMGRLTLNMLLSFAQFEREVCGERIRDKIAATKRRGVWVCGQPPIGYRLKGSGDQRGLRIVPKEAELVRAIFAGYIKSGSLVKLAAALTVAGHTTKRWQSAKGHTVGGRPLDNKYVYRVLTNPIYLGQITHTRGGKTEVWPGLHEPIVDRALWDRVQERMAKAERETRHQWAHTHLLKGKLRTFEGYAMSPASVQRPAPKSAPTKGRHLVRYYVSQKAIRHGHKSCPIKNINAAHLDDLVRALVMDRLLAAHGVDLRPLAPASRDHWIRETLTSVTLAPDFLRVEIAADRVQASIEELRAAVAEGSNRRPAPTGRARASRSATSADIIPTCPFTPEIEDCGTGCVLTLRIQIKRLDRRRVLIAPDGSELCTARTLAGQPIPNTAIVNAIGLAFVWHGELVTEGLTIDALAKKYGFSDTRVQDLLNLTQLHPAILKAALTGNLPGQTSLRDLVIAGIDLDWSRQEQ